MNVRSAVGRLFGSPEGNGGPGREALQYFAASLVSLAVDLAIFSASIRLFGVAWVWAATLGFAAGVVTAYWLSISWVFSARRLKHVPHSEFMIFAGIGVAGLAFTQVVLWIGIEGLHVQPELAKLAAAGATFLFNFAIRKTVLFRGR